MNLGLSIRWTLGILIICAVTISMKPVFLMRSYYQTDEYDVISLLNEIFICQPGNSKIMGMFGDMFLSPFWLVNVLFPTSMRASSMWSNWDSLWILVRL